VWRGALPKCCRAQAAGRDLRHLLGWTLDGTVQGLCGGREVAFGMVAAQYEFLVATSMAVFGTMGLAATRKTASAKKTAPPTPAPPALGMTVPTLGMAMPALEMPVTARDFGSDHDHAAMR
jgi:hypothetical protein